MLPAPARDGERVRRLWILRETGTSVRRRMSDDGDQAAADPSDRASDDAGSDDGSTEDAATDAESDAVAEARAHLQDVEDGCGCTEVWKHLSERREE